MPYVNYISNVYVSDVNPSHRVCQIASYIGLYWVFYIVYWIARAILSTHTTFTDHMALVYDQIIR